MVSALGFIGGGLLEGIGKGLVETGVAKRERALKAIEQKNRLERDEKQMEGKAKFERVLADLEHKRALERDEVRLEGRRGLLGTTIGAQEDAAEIRAKQTVKASEVATGVATTTAKNLATSQKELEKLRQKNRLALEGATTTDTSAAEKRAFDSLIKIHTVADENDIETTDWNAVADGLDKKGFGDLAKAARSRGKAIIDLDIRKRAKQSAKKTVDEIETMFSFSEFDKYGGTKEQAFQFFVRKFIADETGGTPPTLPGPSQTPPTTRPAAAGGDPYVGKAPPPSHPEAKRAKDGFWYVPDPNRPGKFKQVQKTQANRAPSTGKRARGRLR